MGNAPTTPRPAKVSSRFACDVCREAIPDDHPRVFCIDCTKSATVAAAAAAAAAQASDEERVRRRAGPATFDACDGCWMRTREEIHAGHLFHRFHRSSPLEAPDQSRMALSMAAALKFFCGSAITDPAGRPTLYIELYRWARALQAHLQGRLQLPRGSAVLLLAENSPLWIAADLACMFAGLLSVPVFHALPESDVVAVALLSRPAALLLSPTLARLLPALSKALSPLPPVISLGPSSFIIPNPEPTTSGESTAVLIAPGIEEIRQDLEDRSCWLPFRPALQPGDAISVIFTSGSTGTPKGTLFSDLMLNSENADYFGGALFCYEPLAYSTQRVLVLSSMRSGFEVTIFSGLMEQFLDELRRAAPTIFSAPPRIWNMLHSLYQDDLFDLPLKRSFLASLRADFSGTMNPDHCTNPRRYEADLDLSWSRHCAALARQRLGHRIQRISTGGAPIGEQVWKWMRNELELRCSEGFGATEVGQIASNGLRSASCMVHIEDVPEMGYSASTSPQRGLLWVRTPYMASGYLRDTAATDEAFRVRPDLDGEVWYNTGDVVEYDPNTEAIKVIDRLKHIVKLASAFFVCPERLENIFIQSRLVKAIYIHAESSFEHVVAVVQPNLPPHCAEVGVYYHPLLSDITKLGRQANLAPHEIPPSLILDTEPWTPENGLLTISFKLARPALKRHFQQRLQDLYHSLHPHQSPPAVALPSSAAPSTSSPPHATQLEELFSRCRFSTAPGTADLRRLGADSTTIIQISALLKRAGCQQSFHSLLSLSPQEVLHLLRPGAHSSPSPLSESDSTCPAYNWLAELQLPPDLATLISQRHRKPCRDEHLRQVLLTGATGFLGIHILHDILTHCPDTRVLCLVRDAFQHQAQERLQKTARYYRLSLPMDRVGIVLGHFEKRRFGLQKGPFADLARSIGCIIHNGAWVNGVFPYSELRPYNVGGTLEVIRLAASSPFLVRVCYVSSLSAFHHEIRSTERDIPSSDLRLISRMSGYGASKRVSEILLSQASAAGLLVSIVRPGSICGSIASGRSNPNDFLSKFFRSFIELGCAPQVPDHVVFTMVSVDSVARLVALVAVQSRHHELLALLSASPEQIPIFHISGASEPISMPDLITAARAAAIPVDHVPYADWIALIQRIDSPGPWSLFPLKSYFASGFPSGGYSDPSGTEAHAVLLQEQLTLRGPNFQLSGAVPTSLQLTSFFQDLIQDCPD